MSKIEVEYNDNLLQIKKIRTRQSDDDFESIDVSKLVYKEEYQSKIKVTNADEKNKIMLFKRLSKINNDDTYSILLVLSLIHIFFNWSSSRSNFSRRSSKTKKNNE